MGKFTRWRRVVQGFPGSPVPRPAGRKAQGRRGKTRPCLSLKARPGDWDPGKPQEGWEQGRGRVSSGCEGLEAGRPGRRVRRGSRGRGQGLASARGCGDTEEGIWQTVEAGETGLLTDRGNRGKGQGEVRSGQEPGSG